MIRLQRPRRLELGALCVLLLTLVAAPTPGDIGGCGQTAQQLDAATFFQTKAKLDCDRCQECNIAFNSCTVACDPNTTIPTSFPQGCYPLVHDGEVCLHALYDASCDDYLHYMDDNAPSTPSECNFCPVPS